MAGTHTAPPGEVYFEVHLATPSDAASKAIRVNMTEDRLIVRTPTDAGLQFTKHETSNLRYPPGSAKLFEMSAQQAA
jgi:hypothetical protein